MTKLPSAYKQTLFDRHGPDAGAYLTSCAYGFLVFGLSLAASAFPAAQGYLGLSAVVVVGLIVLSAAIGATVSALAIGLSNSAGAGFAHLMANGSTTPYKEQYSYQQALVMQGKVSEALASYEAVIAQTPNSVDARVKAAELYAGTKGGALRAAELFRQIQRIPSVTAGEEIYATNRLVDLFNGPLAEPGRALVELRRMIERYPRSAAAYHARDALIALKPVVLRRADRAAS